MAKFPEQNPNPVLRADSDAVAVYSNGSAAGISRLFADAKKTRLAPELAQCVKLAVHSGEPQSVDLELGDRTYNFVVAPVQGESYLNVYGRDISAERKAKEAVLAAKDSLEERVKERTASVRLLQNIVLAANEANSMEEALQTALHEVCIYTGWPVGHAYVIADDGEGIVPTGIWHIDLPERFAALKQATENMRFGDNDDLPGRVLRSRQAIWLEDLGREAEFPRAEFTKDIGVRSGMAFPVVLNDEVVAILEFFAVEPSPPNANTLTTLCIAPGSLDTSLSHAAGLSDIAVCHA